MRWAIAAAIMAAALLLCEASPRLHTAALAQPAPPAIPSPATPAPPDRLAAVRTRGELVVCIWPEYHRISWRNPRTSELEGLDIDMARALAARLGVRAAFLEGGWAEVLDRTAAGTCDVAMTGVGITAARNTRLAFTKPYLASPAYAVASRDSNRVRDWADLDRAGVVVAVTAGTVQETLMRETLRRAELMVVQPPRLPEAEVQAGRADAYVSDYPNTRPLAEGRDLGTDWARIIEPPPRSVAVLDAYAVPRNEPAWLAEINAFLTTAKTDGTLAHAAARHGLEALVQY